MGRCRQLLLLVGLVWAGPGLPAAERIPPAPPRYFNDYAGVVSPATAARLNQRLEQSERDSSNQLLVAIYPRMESNSAVEDYTVRVAQAWRAGQTARDNGAVLFAFMQEHKLYLQVGYGLEGVLPDVTAKRIIADEIVPRFRTGDIDGGMTAAVEAMIAATKGEYHGTGQTRADRAGRSGRSGSIFTVLVGVLFFVAITIRSATRRSQVVYGNPTRRGYSSGPTFWSGGGPWGSGGNSSGGGSFGGGGFSGGGGGFGGGGAGGSW